MRAFFVILFVFKLGASDSVYRSEVPSQVGIKDEVEDLRSEETVSLSSGKEVGPLESVCADVYPLIGYDADFCRDQCVELIDVCKDTDDPVACVAKQRAHGPENNQFFKRCRFPQSFQGSVEAVADRLGNRCFIMRSIHRGSWVDEGTKSCHCALINAEPCGEEDISDKPEEVAVEFERSGLCPRHGTLALFDDDMSKFSVSIAGGKRVHCPGTSARSVTEDRSEARVGHKGPEVTSLGDDMLGNFCQQGPIYSSFSTDPVTEGWNYSCGDVSTLEGGNGTECQEACKEIETHCNRFDDQAIECLRDRIAPGSDQSMFPDLNCGLPEGEFEGDLMGYCGQVYANSENNSECLRACIAVADMCEAYAVKTKQTCLNSIFKEKEEEEQDEDDLLAYETEPIQEKIANFRNKCAFTRENSLGRGYVFCKLKEARCKYSSWSEWSKCTADCIDYDRIPTRYRKREILGSKHCVGEKLGTLEFQICANLPTCRSRRWITGEFSGTEVVRNLEEFAKRKDRGTEWTSVAVRQYPEILDSGFKSKLDCDGFKREDVCVIKKAVVKKEMGKTRSVCPRGYKGISFANFRKSRDLMEQLGELCERNRHNRLVFYSKGRYVYYCGIGFLIKDMEDEGVVGEAEAVEHVPCKRILRRKLAIGSGKMEFLVMAILKYGLIAIGIGAVWSCWLFIQGYRVEFGR